MGRAMRWLKKLLTGKKEDGKDRKVNNAANDGEGVVAARDKRRWSFTKQRNSGVDGAGKRPSVAAVAAAELSQVRPCHCGEEREVEATVMIQKAFRGYLARKALRALKSLVKLQALVRGYLVRKQAATTLHKLQALMRLQASTSALKMASSRKSIEQDRMVAQETRIKPLAAAPPVVHRRRLSDGTDSNFERSPRIVEMDTCQLRCRSSRMSFRYTPDSSDVVPSVVPLSSPLFFNYRQPSSRLQDHELRHSKTAHNTPRLGALTSYDSPAKCRVQCRDGSPRYMADTASSVAKMRCQSAPRQRQGAAPVSEPRPSLNRAASRKSPAQLQQDSFSLRSSELSRMEGFEFSDEPTRDYYLDQLW